MIVALLTDSFLRATVRKAALPEEDVFWNPEDVHEALRIGYPRLAVCATGQPYSLGEPRDLVGPALPLLVITPATLDEWRVSHEAAGFAVRRVDDHGRRLRTLMEVTAGRASWVNDVFRDLARSAGAGVPQALRGFGRRILEFPSRYDDLHSLARLSGISRGALKARFRRRDLPSPYTYLRWFRVVAAARVLSETEVTTEEAAYRVGLHSSGNFCRYVQEVSGLSPSELKEPMGRVRIVTRFVEECLGRPEMRGWEGLEDLFLEGAA